MELGPLGSSAGTIIPPEMVGHLIPQEMDVSLDGSAPSGGYVPIRDPTAFRAGNEGTRRRAAENAVTAVVPDADRTRGQTDRNGPAAAGRREP
jgi:hypothetical protein